MASKAASKLGIAKECKALAVPSVPLRSKMRSQTGRRAGCSITVLYARSKPRMMKDTSISKQEYTKLTLRKLDAKVAKKASLKYVLRLKIARNASLQHFKVSQQTKVYSADF